MDVLAVMPSTNAVGSTAHAVRVSLRNSRARLRAPRLARKQGTILPAISENKSEMISMCPPHMDDSRSGVTRKVSLWHSESGAIEIMSLPHDDITLPLIHVKGLLRKAIDDVKLSGYLFISNKQAEWIAVIIDQLLAHSHVAAAMSLSRKFQRVATVEDHLIAPCGLDISDITAQVPHFQSGTNIVPIKRTLSRRRFVNGLWTTQNFSKTTPWGTIKAEIYLIGDRLYSEILCFRVRFSANRQLSDIGVVIDYASHHANSLVCFSRQQSELAERHIAVYSANLRYDRAKDHLLSAWIPGNTSDECGATWYTGFPLSDIEVHPFLEATVSKLATLQQIMSLLNDVEFGDSHLQKRRAHRYLTRAMATANKSASPRHIHSPIPNTHTHNSYAQFTCPIHPLECQPPTL